MGPDVVILDTKFIDLDDIQIVDNLVCALTAEN